MKTFNSFAFWTNIFFIFPIYVSFANNIWWHGLFVLSVTYISFLYHAPHGYRFANIDKIAAISLMIMNLFLLFKGFMLNRDMIWFYFSIISAIVALLLLYKQDKVLGGSWFVAYFFCCSNGILSNVLLGSLVSKC